MDKDKDKDKKKPRCHHGSTCKNNSKPHREKFWHPDRASKEAAAEGAIAEAAAAAAAAEAEAAEAAAAEFSAAAVDAAAAADAAAADAAAAASEAARRIKQPQRAACARGGVPEVYPEHRAACAGGGCWQHPAVYPGHSALLVGIGSEPSSSSSSSSVRDHVLAHLNRVNTRPTTFNTETPDPKFTLRNLKNEYSKILITLNSMLMQNAQAARKRFLAAEENVTNTSLPEETFPLRFNIFENAKKEFEKINADVATAQERLALLESDIKVAEAAVAEAEANAPPPQPARWRKGDNIFWHPADENGVRWSSSSHRANDPRGVNPWFNDIWPSSSSSVLSPSANSTNRRSSEGGSRRSKRGVKKGNNATRHKNKGSRRSRRSRHSRRR
jgi:hypothetical protein